MKRNERRGNSEVQETRPAKEKKGDLGQSLKATYYGVLGVGDVH